MCHVEVESLRKKRVETQGSDRRTAQLQTSDPKTNINWEKENPRELTDQQWERGNHTADLEASPLDPAGDIPPSGRPHPVLTSSPARRGDEDYAGDPCEPGCDIKKQHLWETECYREREEAIGKPPNWGIKALAVASGAAQYPFSSRILPEALSDAGD